MTVGQVWLSLLAAVVSKETSKEITDVMIDVINLDSNYMAQATEYLSVKRTVIVKGTKEVLDTIQSI